MKLRIEIYLLCLVLGFCSSIAQARFCTGVTTVGAVTKGNYASVNQLDRNILEVRSMPTKSRMVQQADITFTFRIPEQVSLIDVSAMQMTLIAQSNTTYVHTLVEGWNNALTPVNPKNKKAPRRVIGWVGLDAVTLGITQEHFRLGIPNAKQFINSKTRELRLRIRTKRETTTPFFLKVNAIQLVGIRAEGLADYGDLFLVDADKKSGTNFEASLKKIKNDWDLSFNKGGRLIPIKDWESTAERKEKLKKDWRDNYNRKGKVISFESQMKSKR